MPNSGGGGGAESFPRDVPRRHLADARDTSPSAAVLCGALQAVGLQRPEPQPCFDRGDVDGRALQPLRATDHAALVFKGNPSRQCRVVLEKAGCTQG